MRVYHKVERAGLTLFLACEQYCTPGLQRYARLPSCFVKREESFRHQFPVGRQKRKSTPSSLFYILIVSYYLMPVFGLLFMADPWRKSNSHPSPQLRAGPIVALRREKKMVVSKSLGSSSTFPPRPVGGEPRHGRIWWWWWWCVYLLVSLMVVYFVSGFFSHTKARDGWAALVPISKGFFPSREAPLEPDC